jgi:uncharacterized protein YbaP (TraB family)
MAGILRRIWLVAAAAGLFLHGPVAAAGAPEPPPVLAKIKAHPALWIVHSPTATAYLFGSIHLLPSNLDWHSRSIDAALAASDVFVFEAPLGDTGQQQGQDFVGANGMLPPDTSLPSLLDGQARQDYRDAVLAAHVSPESLVHMRPWLAAIVLENGIMEAAHYSPMSGVDRQVYALATAEHKSIETFETVNEQLAMLMPKKQNLEVEEFDAALKELKTDMSEVGPLVDAWSDGRMSDVAKLMNKGFASTPGAMKLLIDDRNARWVQRMASLMAERHTYFITVGAGHLAGPHGLPVLLAARGYRVDLSAPKP